MAIAMYHDQTSPQMAGLTATTIIDKAEVDRLVAEAYAKGRSDAFTFLGLDEKDFPEGDGVHAWIG